MALTKEQRDDLADDDFAVPSKRVLPIRNTPNDRDHVKMAWSMVDYTKGLSTTERSEARRKILTRAHELGIDTAGWHKPTLIEPSRAANGALRAMRFEAMSLDVPHVADHPNRAPFSGVLTRVGEPSDNPVGGANGKRVLIPKAVAEAALPSLLGMGVDYTAGLDGHAAQQKIGLITGATIDGDGLHIEGFLYGADFPAVVADIQARKSLLGFSYEAQASVADWNRDPVEVTSCVFTGAAILLKDKAAYTSTSLAAHAAESEIDDMNAQEILDAMTALKAQNEKMALQLAELQASSKTLTASSVLHKVKPHTDRLRAAADEMEKDGIGLHDKRGHVAHLRRMADKMDAEAVMGKLPHIFTDETWLDAAADKPNAEVEALKAKVAELESHAFNAAAAPERKTQPAGSAKPAVGANVSSADTRVRDAELKAAGANTVQRLAAITEARMSAQ